MAPPGLDPEEGSQRCDAARVNGKENRAGMVR